MLMLVNCSNCHTPLQLPPGAQSIRCAICHAITRIAQPRSLQQPPPPPPPSSTHHHPYGAAPSMAPSPYNYAPPGPSPSVHGRKRAVICGISYRNSRYELKGCINDANCMKYLLLNRFNFPESSILMLTVIVQKKKLILTGDQLRATLEWRCIGLCKVVNQETPWFFIILAMAHSNGTTLETRWMDMMKHSVP